MTYIKKIVHNAQTRSKIQTLAFYNGAFETRQWTVGLQNAPGIRRFKKTSFCLVVSNVKL